MEWNRNQTEENRMGIKEFNTREKNKSQSGAQRIKENIKQKRVQVQSSLDWINVCRCCRRCCCYCFLQRPASHTLIGQNEMVGKCAKVNSQHFTNTHTVPSTYRYDTQRKRKSKSKNALAHMQYYRIHQ